MTDGKPPKRPRDTNRLAKSIVDSATGDAPAPAEDNRDPAAVARGASGGKKGGKARAAKLTKEQRSAIARKAARERWQKTKPPREPEPGSGL